jgi:hypothetical protein
MYGPLPARPAESGWFVMEVSRYGDRPSWQLTTEGRGAGV